MKKLAIIGASYLQEPLIQKAKSMGIETHVFAWAANDVGEKIADYFYPISIIEKDEILEKCREIGIDGICSIASDLANITVNYVADKLGLVGNSMECTERSTNKHRMRNVFAAYGDPSPRSVLIQGLEDLSSMYITYPVIIKPMDRSGSRGITKVTDVSQLEPAIEYAREQGFEKAVLMEEFAEGREYSVECISWKGEHHFLALTKKYTTGAPGFIETAHLEPAPVSENTLAKVKDVVFHALNSLKVEYGASHSEIKIDDDGNIKIIEIGSRMGGDFIGSTLVELSTGFDFVKAVIDIALGIKPDFEYESKGKAAAVRFVLGKTDEFVFEKEKQQNQKLIYAADIDTDFDHEVVDSSTRFGYFLMQAEDVDALLPYLQY